MTVYNNRKSVPRHTVFWHGPDWKAEWCMWALRIGNVLHMRRQWEVVEARGGCPYVTGERLGPVIVRSKQICAS